MYVLFVVHTPPNADPSDGDYALERFSSAGPVRRAAAGALQGCMAINPFTFQFSGDYVRALVELQRAADEAKVPTSLLTFPEAPTAAVTAPRP